MFGVLAIALGILRIEFAQDIGNLGHDDLCIFRIEPDVTIGIGMTMTMPVPVPMTMVVAVFFPDAARAGFM